MSSSVEQKAVWREKASRRVGIVHCIVKQFRPARAALLCVTSLLSLYNTGSLSEHVST